MQRKSSRKNRSSQKTEKSSGLSLDDFSLTTTKKEAKVPTQSRLAFTVKNEGIKLESCNLPFTDNGEVFVPNDMKIHDYFKNNIEYHFAVSVASKQFLLNAKSIVKNSAYKEALSHAFKFAKYCKIKAQKASVATPTSTKKTVAAQVKSRDIKNLEVLITQQESAVQFHKDQITKLSQALNY